MCNEIQKVLESQAKVESKNTLNTQNTWQDIASKVRDALKTADEGSYSLEVRRVFEAESKKPPESKTSVSLQSKLHTLDPEVRNALESIDRELFVPPSFKNIAYSLDPLPMGGDQWISSPLTVAKMTQYLTPADSVLEIGCGSGYQAMVLSKIFRRVFTIERIEKLLLEARERFRKSNATNINTRFDDGQNGWKEYAPYDRILFSACIDSAIPQTIIDQLEEGGILVAPMKQEGRNAKGELESKQVIKRFHKRHSKLVDEEILEECLFVPVLNGIER